MQKFSCVCGQRVFFENTSCTVCGRLLGYDPDAAEMLALRKTDDHHWQTDDGKAYKPCRNYREYNVCNWVLPHDAKAHYCLACSLNEMIPAIAAPEKRRGWAAIETAKRRLIVTLLKLQLPVVSKKRSPDGLGFAFMEDKRVNPRVKEEFVATGHADGLITVNLAEADDARREQTRVSMGEPYRTLLGHFRHESGHYYFDRLVKNSDFINRFRELFGDDRKNYDQALADYYKNPPGPGWKNGFISDYAQAHPLEDWAECWAHYLHMVDTLETAAGAGIVQDHFASGDIEQWLLDWSKVTIELNSLNRSMGLRDAYPFILAEPSLTKIRFVHQVVHPTPPTN